MDTDDSSEDIDYSDEEESEDEGDESDESEADDDGGIILCDCVLKGMYHNAFPCDTCTDICCDACTTFCRMCINTSCCSRSCIICSVVICPNCINMSGYTLPSTSSPMKIYDYSRENTCTDIEGSCGQILRNMCVDCINRHVPLPIDIVLVIDSY